jgi:hypothetical protein
MTNNRVFTGGGLPAKAGQACTTNSQCGNPPDPLLVQCATSFPGGYCFVSSALETSGAWCQSAGRPLIGLPLPDGGVSYECAGTCPTIGQLNPNGRTGYTCLGNRNGTGNVMWPACTSNATCGPQAPVCDTSRGVCCTNSSFTSCADSF